MRNNGTNSGVGENVPELLVSLKGNKCVRTWILALHGDITDRNMACFLLLAKIFAICRKAFANRLLAWKMSD